jgi:hypothetical protein
MPLFPLDNVPPDAPLFQRTEKTIWQTASPNLATVPIERRTLASFLPGSQHLETLSVECIRERWGQHQ